MKYKQTKMIVKTLIQKTNQSDKKVKDLWKHLGISQTTYYNWKDYKTSPNAKQIEAWCKFLGIKFNFLN